MDKDTVLLVSTSYPMEADGSEAAGAFVADFALALAAHLPVRVVGPGLIEGPEQGGSLPTWRFWSGGRPLSLLSPLKPWHWPAIMRVLWSLRRQVFLAAADGRVGHIHALWVLPSGWSARALASATGATYSVWALGSDIWSLGRIPLVRGLLVSVSRGARFAFADGLGLARDAEALCGRAFEFLPSCRALAGTRGSAVAGAPPFRFLYLGRWHPNKGTDLLLDALDALRDEDWSRIAEVHLAGGGPMRSLVEERVGRLVAAGHPVRLSGFLDRAGAESALGNADRLLLPSRIESIPVVFSDALAYGLPVVSMPVGDLPDLLSSGGGWLARAVDAGAFADAIRLSLEPTNPSDGALAALRARFHAGSVAAQFASKLREGR